MSKSKARFLAELLSSDGKVIKTKSEASTIIVGDLPTIPNSKLANSSVTIAGEGLSLGASLTLDTADVTEHTNYKYYTDARAITAVSGSDLDMSGRKVLFGNMYSSTGDLPSASTYHGMFAHVHGTGKGYFAHAGSWVELANQSGLTTATTTANAALPKAGGAMTGAITTNSTFDGVDIATRDAVLTSTTTTANAALPKAGGTMTGSLRLNDVAQSIDFIQSGAINFDSNGDQTGRVLTIGSNRADGASGGTTNVEFFEDGTSTFANNVNIGAAATNSSKLRVNGKIVAGDVSSSTGDVLLEGYYGNGATVVIGSERSSGGVFLGYGVQPSATTQHQFLSSTVATLTQSAYVVADTHRWWTASSGSSVAVGSQVTSMTQRMTILANGNVGIGTTTPMGNLSVTGSSAAVGDQGIFQVTDGTGANTDTKIVMGVVASDYGWIQAVKPGTNVFDLALQPNGGKVGIGTANPGTSRLKVYNSTVSGNTRLHIHNDKSGDAAELRLEGKRTSANDTGQLLFANNGSIVARIDAVSAGDDGALRLFTSASGTGDSVLQAMSISAAGAATFNSTITATSVGQHQIATTLFSNNIIKSSKTSEAGASIRMAVSNAANPTYAFVDDTNTGMFTSGADTLGFTTAGAQRMSLSSTGLLTFASANNADGISLGTNCRIYGGANRAFEANSSASSQVQIAEGYASSGSTRIMSKLILDKQTDAQDAINIVNETAAPTNSASLPGALIFKGKGWDSNSGSNDIQGKIELKAAYGDHGSGATQGSLVFSLQGAGGLDSSSEALIEGMRLTAGGTYNHNKPKLAVGVEYPQAGLHVAHGGILLNGTTTNAMGGTHGSNIWTYIYTCGTTGTYNGAFRVNVPDCDNSASSVGYGGFSMEVYVAGYDGKYCHAFLSGYTNTGITLSESAIRASSGGWSVSYGSVGYQGFYFDINYPSGLIHPCAYIRVTKGGDTASGKPTNMSSLSTVWT